MPWKRILKDLEEALKALEEVFKGLERGF